VPTYLPLGPLPIGVVGTDAKGRFALSNLPPGKTELEAYKVGYGREAALDVAIRVGETTANVRIELRQDLDVEVTKINARGSLAVTLSETVHAKRRVVIFEHVPLGGEAQRAGILAGDRFISFNGTPIRSIEHARRWLNGPLSEDFVVELERGEELRWRVRVRRERVRR
jgi:membrane-associated protease RseP (regulator of RpoE activity)